MASPSSLLGFPFAPIHVLHSAYGFSYTPATPLSPPIPAGGPVSPICHYFTHIAGTGISTSCPSTTLLSLALGPDLPWADEPSPGNLSQMVIGILTQYRYLHRHSHFHPLHDSFRYRFADDGTLPYHSLESATSVLCLAPVNFRRRGTRLVSCYALFK